VFIVAAFSIIDLIAVADVEALLGECLCTGLQIGTAQLGKLSIR